MDLTKRMVGALAVASVLLAAAVPAHAGPVAAKRKAAVVTTTTEAYGTDPLQVVTLRRNTAVTAPGKLVIFLHGGGWNGGGRGSLEAEAIEWAKTGWVSVNVSYRTAVYDDAEPGTPGADDGRAILADVLAVLLKYRGKSYVDPTKVVVYGESAGGHLATWVGALKGPQVRAIVAISPVSSISGAIEAGRAEGAPAKVASLGDRAWEFFGYSVGTTDAHRYMDRVQGAAIAFSTDEYVAPDIHGRAFCAELTTRCEQFEFAGTAHAGTLADQQPQLLVDLRHWAGNRVATTGAAS